ncbi:MAG: hypothetical protein NT154_15540 [Verrucomicrobia bacterium]|nr:hypothetical protein [Verrucomicrobiota bacterium]
MNQCPHCHVTASPLRLMGDPPYICPKCGEHSTNAEPRTELLKVVTAFITAGGGGLLYAYVELIRNHTFLLIVSVIVVFVVSWVLLRWAFGRLSPLPKDD